MFDGDDFIYSREESGGSTQTAGSSTAGRRGGRGGRGGRGRGGRGRGRTAGTRRADATSVHSTDDLELTPVTRRGRGGRGGRGSSSRGRVATPAPAAGNVAATAATVAAASQSRAETPLSHPPTPPADGVPVKRKRGRPPKNPPSLPSSLTGSPNVAGPSLSTTPATTRRRLTTSTTSSPRTSALMRGASRRASAGAVSASAPSAGSTATAASASASGLAPTTATMDSAESARRATSVLSSSSSVTAVSARTPPPAPLSGTSTTTTSVGRPRRRLEVLDDDEESGLGGGGGGGSLGSRTPTELSRGGTRAVTASTRVSLSAARSAASAASAVRHDAQTLLRQAQAERDARVARLRDRLVWKVKRFRAQDDDRQGVVHDDGAVGISAPDTHWLTHATAPRMPPSSAALATSSSNDGSAASLSPSVAHFEATLARQHGAYTLTRARTTPAQATAAASTVSAMTDSTRVGVDEGPTVYDDLHIAPLHALSPDDVHDATSPSVAALLCPCHIFPPAWAAHATSPSKNEAEASPSSEAQGRFEGAGTRLEDGYAVSLLQRVGLVDASGQLHLPSDAGAATFAGPSTTAPSPASCLERLVQEAASHVTSSTSAQLTSSWAQYAAHAMTGAGSTSSPAVASVSPLLMDSLACHAQPHVSLYAPLMPRAGTFVGARQHWQQTASTDGSGWHGIVKSETASATPPPFMRQQTTGEVLVRHAEQSVVVPVVVGSHAQLVDANSRDKSHVWTVYVRGLFDGCVGAVARMAESHSAAPTTADTGDTTTTTNNNKENPLLHLEENYLAQFVESVTFVLDKSFTPCVRTVYAPPYEVTEHGWGEFVVSIHVHLRYQGYTHTPAARQLRHELRHFAYTSHGRAVLQGSAPPNSTGRALFDPVTNSLALFGGTTASSATTTATTTTAGVVDGAEVPTRTSPASPLLHTTGETTTTASGATVHSSAGGAAEAGADAESTATGVGSASGGGTLRGAVVHPHAGSRRLNFAQQLLDMNHCSAIRPLVYRGPLLPPHLQVCDSESTSSDSDNEVKVEKREDGEEDEEAGEKVNTRQPLRIKREAEDEEQGETAGSARGGGRPSRRRPRHSGAWMSDLYDVHHTSNGTTTNNLTDNFLMADNEDDDTGGSGGSGGHSSSHAHLMGRTASVTTLNTDEDGDERGDGFPVSPLTADPTARTLSNLGDDATPSSACATSAPTPRALGVPPRRGPGRPAPSEAARRTRLRKAAAHAAARAEAARQLEGNVRDSNVVILSHALRFSHRTTLPTGIPPTGDFRTDLARREQYSGYVLVPEPVVTEQYDEIVIPLIQPDTSSSSSSSSSRPCWSAATNSADQQLLLAAGVLETNARRVLHQYLRERGFGRNGELRPPAAAATNAASSATTASSAGGHWSGPPRKASTGAAAGGGVGGVGGVGGAQGGLQKPRAGTLTTSPSLEDAVTRLSGHASRLSCWPQIVESGDAATRDAVLTASYLSSVAASARSEGWLAHSLAANHQYWFAAHSAAPSSSSTPTPHSSHAHSLTHRAAEAEMPSAAVLAIEDTDEAPAAADGEEGGVVAYQATSAQPIPYLLTALEFDLLSLLLLLPALAPRYHPEMVLASWVGPQASASTVSLLTSTILAQLVCVSHSGSGGTALSPPSPASLAGPDSRTAARPSARRQRLLTADSTTCPTTTTTRAMTLPDLKSTLHTALDAVMTARAFPLLCYPHWRPTDASLVTTLASLTCAPPSSLPGAIGGGGARHNPVTAAATFTSGTPCGLFGADKDVQRLQMHREALLRAIDEMRQEIVQRQAIEVLKRA